MDAAVQMMEKCVAGLAISHGRNHPAHFEAEEWLVDLRETWRESQ